MYVYGASLFYISCSDCVGVCGNVCCVAAVVEACCMLCKECDGCCVFCLYCDAWSCRCSCMGSMSVSSCRCCIFVSCVHPVAVHKAAFCMTCNLLILVEDSRDCHMEEAYSRAGLMIALYVAMSVFFCLPHPFALCSFPFVVA